VKAILGQLDQEVHGRLGQYAAQCGLATVACLVIMLSLDLMIRHVVIMASLGATTFIVFAMPQGRTAQGRSLAVGYLLGGAVGCLLSLLVGPLARLVGCPEDIPRVVLGALAVGLCTFGMVLLDAEHPPAAGFALGLVLRPWAWIDLGFVSLSVLLLILTRLALRRRLVDLL